MPDISISAWAIATIGGPIILAAALTYGVLRQRRRRRLREQQRFSSAPAGHDQR